MCEYKVKRVLQENGDQAEEWRKLDGSWTPNSTEAEPISEEDAKAHIGQLRRLDGVPGSYAYESVLVG